MKDNKYDLNIKNNYDETVEMAAKAGKIESTAE